MNNSNDLFSDLRELISQLEEQKTIIYDHLDNFVSQIIAERNTNQNEIAHVMDSLLDFGDDDRFLALYKKLCRYVYDFYPEMVGEHIHLYRLQFEGEDSEDEIAE